MKDSELGRTLVGYAGLVAAIIGWLLFAVGCSSPGATGYTFTPTALLSTVDPTASPTAQVTLESPTAGPPGVPFSTPTAALTIVDVATPTASLSVPASPPEATVPPRPALVADYPSAIAAYLATVHGNSSRLAYLFNAWNLPIEPKFTVMSADSDGDGEAEFIVGLIAVAKDDGQPDTQPHPIGTLILLDRTRDSWRGYLLHNPDTETSGALNRLPEVMKVADINKDGRTEVVFTTGYCGAHTCFTSVHILAWNGQEYRPLAIRPATLSYADVTLDDVDADGVSEVTMSGGIVGSVGAGPQRRHTDIYRWDGASYVLWQTTYEPSKYLYHKIVDADRELEKGQFTAALALYEQVLSDESLQTWEALPDPALERENLRAFAQFRIALVYARIGDRDKMHAAIEENLRDDGQHPYAKLGAVLGRAYESAENIQTVCQVITKYTGDHPELVEPVSSYGYANPTITIEDLCPW